MLVVVFSTAKMGSSNRGGMALASASTTVALATTTRITAIYIACFGRKNEGLTRGLPNNFLISLQVYSILSITRSSRASTVQPVFYIDDHLEN